MRNGVFIQAYDFSRSGFFKQIRKGEFRRYAIAVGPKMSHNRYIPTRACVQKLAKIGFKLRKKFFHGLSVKFNRILAPRPPRL